MINPVLPTPPPRARAHPVSLVADDRQPIRHKINAISYQVLSRQIAELGIYPAVDPLDSTSRMLDPRVIGDEHYETARATQKLLQDYKGLQVGPVSCVLVPLLACFVSVPWVFWGLPFFSTFFFFCEKVLGRCTCNTLTADLKSGTGEGSHKCRSEHVVVKPKETLTAVQAVYCIARSACFLCCSLCCQSAASTGQLPKQKVCITLDCRWLLYTTRDITPAQDNTHTHTIPCQVVHISTGQHEPLLSYQGQRRHATPSIPTQ